MRQSSRITHRDAPDLDEMARPALAVGKLTVDRQLTACLQAHLADQHPE